MATKRVSAANIEVGDVVVHNRRKFEIIWKSSVQTKDGQYAFDARADNKKCSRTIAQPSFTMDVLR